MDKENIIIDGIDVSKCKWFEYQRYAGIECDKFKNVCYNKKFKSEFCKDNQDCYFKQLQHKTAEYEELKNKLNEYERAGGILDEGEAWYGLAKRYEQALNEIKQCIDELDWTMLEYMYKRINDIICKAKDSNNE